MMWRCESAKNKAARSSHKEVACAGTCVFLSKSDWIKQRGKSVDKPIEKNSIDIKCIALDLDRTTLRSDGTLSERTRRALEKVIAAGIEVIIASGRPLSSLPSAVTSIPGIRYAVTSNGAVVCDLSTGKRLYARLMPGDSVAAVLDYCKGMNVTFECIVNGNAYADITYLRNPVCFGVPQSAVPYVQSSRTAVPDIKNFILEQKYNLDSMDVIVPSADVRDMLLAELGRKFSELYVTSSVYTLVEMSDKNCGKHNGLQFLLDALGIDWGNLAAFGDADNDYEMLQMAGLGVAVENASKKCRSAADVITLSNDQDGVAVILEKKIFICDTARGL